MDLDKALHLLSLDPTAAVDLAEVALLLARDEYPDVDVEAYMHVLAGMAHEARSSMHGGIANQVRGLCRYLFHDLGFRGNTQDYYDPQNSYLNEVIERRTGIPITLSLVAMAVGNRAGLEILGVGLPGHFIAKAVDGADQVLFDPFHGGRLLSVADCEILVQRATARPYSVSPEDLRATPAGLTVQRLLVNLRGIYLRREDLPRACRVIERLRQLDPHNASHRRDLGVALGRMSQPGRAIDHLAAYLAAAPQAEDAERVRELLHEAEREVARWN